MNRIFSLSCLVFLSSVLVPVDLAIAESSQQLRNEVHDLLKAGHVALPYNQIDEANADIHADPSQPGNLLLFYTARSQNIDQWVSSDARNVWNREHLWPQSRGTRGAPMKSDLFHLIPTDASVNRNRGHLDFDDGGAPEGEAEDTFVDDYSFEPRDHIKGDVARAIFYMDLRHEGTDGEPDLEVVDQTTQSGGTTIGVLCTLLAWHTSDPVDDAERTRNDTTELVQGNRNAFIDRPDLADTLYASGCGVASPTPEACARDASHWHPEHRRPAP